MKVDNAEYALLTAIVIFSGKNRLLHVQLKHRFRTGLVSCRKARVDRRLEGGENPRDLPRGAASVRGQPTEAEAGHDIRKVVIRTNRTSNAWQSKFGNVFLVEVEEQKVATIPHRNLGCRHEDIVVVERNTRRRTRLKRRDGSAE